ncbi:MAG: Phosphohistidine phosphatase SixA [Accumulibacter sp.]|uniref:phosphohistidine phosphatase SixA n=1 Tax=Accumulibacter sp. TaxID=2053492 RepID=UPI001218F019|nr:phosphohistidine phosphatase SixA [Accumulibacter sp.]TLD46985.1 MAG: Phosphohistidine phosphatase SixA [Accumulibacter sp.]
MSDHHSQNTLYLVQHGEAVAESVDARRPLSEAGRATVDQVATWAARHGLAVDQVRHSGKLRAEQTASILAARLQPPRGVVAQSGMAPNDDVRPVAKTLAGEAGSLMLVGHLPFLARLAALLLSGDSERSLIGFRYACLVGLVRDADQWTISCVVPAHLTRPQ